MPSIFQTNDAKGIKPAPIPGDSDVVAVRYEYSLAAALVINDRIELGVLPADHVPVDFAVDCDDLDTNATPTITLDCGIMSGTPGVADVARTVGTEFLSASTVAQAGGVVRAATVGAFRVAPATSDRSVGVLVKAAPATGAAAGKIGLTLYYRSARYGA